MPSDRVGIEFITVLGLPPVDYVDLAASLDIGHIGIALTPGGDNPHDYPPWSLRDDAALRREFKAALRANGVALSIGEGFLAWPGVPVSSHATDLDLMAELGVPIANIASLDPEPARACAELAAFAELARERGMAATLEFLPGLPIADLPAAIDAIARIGHPAMRLLIDAMHVFRSGSGIDAIAALDRDVVGYFQLCDVPMASGDLSYADEARYERRAPGNGDLPLFDLLEAMPRDLVVGLEVPMRRLATAGVGPRERLAPSVATTREWLAQIDAAASADDTASLRATGE